MLSEIAPKTVFADIYLWGIFASSKGHVSSRMMIKAWLKASLGEIEIQNTAINDSMYVVRCLESIDT